MKAWELQQALFSRLDGYSGLKAIVSAIYDNVSQGATLPYVVIGDDTLIPFDTHSTIGGEHTVTIHSWSGYQGRSEIKRIQSQVYDALHRYALTVSGAVTVTCEQEFAETFVDADGLTRHGVQRFRVMLDG